MPKYQDASDSPTSAIYQVIAERQAAAHEAAKQAHEMLKEQNRQIETDRKLKIEEAKSNREADAAEREHIVKRIAGKVIGDPIEPELRVQADRLGIPLRATVQAPAPEEVPTPNIVQHMGEAPKPMAPLPAGSVRFAGTPAQIEKENERAQAIKLEQMKEAAKTNGSTMKPVLRQNTRKGVVERLVDGQWQPVTGDVVAGAHWMTEPAPKDNSAQTAREATHAEASYKTAITELEKKMAPAAGIAESIDSLGLVLNQKTPAADSLIAPLVLKSTVSGTGSGFRMTQSEINQVLGGRSKWQSLEAALNKWSEDPSKALSVTDEQRQQLRDLAKAIRVKARGKLEKMVKARHDLDDAVGAEGGIDKMHRIMTGLESDMYTPAEDAAPAAPTGPGMSYQEYLSRKGSK